MRPSLSFRDFRPANGGGRTPPARRPPAVAWTKRSSAVVSLARSQAEWLARAVTLTRRGGAIVYCTCSLEPEEGEAQIAALLRRPPDVARLPISADEVGDLTECV